MTRNALTFALALGALAVGIWAATVATRNHAEARDLDHRQRYGEALDAAIDRLEAEIRSAEQELLSETDSEAGGVELPPGAMGVTQ